MKRPIRVRSRSLPGVLVALMLGCASAPRDVVDVGTAGERVATLGYELRGAGAPVVVLESGLGDGHASWDAVVESVAGYSRVLAYDRAGYGASRSPTQRRTGAAAVAELRGLLRELGLEPPYVLVGHSLGGLYVELFARTHPEEIAGVVLVDARHVDFSRRCEPEGVERCGVPWLTRQLMPAGARAELVGLADTEAEIRAAGAFPPVPVRVLTAEQRPASMPRLRHLWAETQRQWLEVSPEASQEICAECGHYIQREAPERVVNAIAEVVDAARAGEEK